MKVYLFLFQNVNEIKNLWEFDKYIKEKSYNLQAGDMKINALSNATYLLIMCLLTKHSVVYTVHVEPSNRKQAAITIQILNP